MRKGARFPDSGGWLLDCRGDQESDPGPNEALLSRGWEELTYMGSFGFPVRRYRKQVIK